MRSVGAWRSRRSAGKVRRNRARRSGVRGEVGVGTRVLESVVCGASQSWGVAGQ